METLAHEGREEPGVCEDRGLILPLHEAVPLTPACLTVCPPERGPGRSASASRKL